MEAHKESPEFYARIFAHAGIAPAEALVVDDSPQALRRAAERAGQAYELDPGGGAFYGPKVEFSLKDSIGRIWQCGTIQVDFSMPGRLGAYYIAADGSKQVPVMLHRAVLGSL